MTPQAQLTIGYVLLDPFDFLAAGSNSPYLGDPARGRALSEMIDPQRPGYIRHGAVGAARDLDLDSEKGRYTPHALAIALTGFNKSTLGHITLADRQHEIGVHCVGDNGLEGGSFYWERFGPLSSGIVIGLSLTARYGGSVFGGGAELGRDAAYRLDPDRIMEIRDAMRTGGFGSDLVLLDHYV